MFSGGRSYIVSSVDLVTPYLEFIDSRLKVRYPRLAYTRMETFLHVSDDFVVQKVSITYSVVSKGYPRKRSSITYTLYKGGSLWH